MIYENIVRLCNENGITVSKLETEAGIGNGIVGRWRYSVPRVDSLKKAADYFGVTVDSLLPNGGQIGTVYGNVLFQKDERSSCGASFSGWAQLFSQMRRFIGDKEAHISVTIRFSDGDGVLD